MHLALQKNQVGYDYQLFLLNQTKIICIIISIFKNAQQNYRYDCNHLHSQIPDTDHK
jgi:hypothetical protein